MKSNLSIQYKGRSEWVNLETGERREVDEFERPVGRNEPFMITYLYEIIKLIDTLGNKKMKVIKYILKNMNKSDNVLVITTTELAEKAGTSRQTVSDTLSLLTEAGIIKRRVGAIMINPKLMNNKRASGENLMLIRYQQFGEESYNQ